MMNDNEYNLYIENYLNNDKTKSAIMLTAPWGMGKSYYIQNCLIPYLEQTSNKKCVVVSLYGLNDIKEISKAIYLEIRSKISYVKNEKYEAGKIVSKTIIKGVLSKVGIDLSLEDEDLEKLYSSIDLANKLIILEDLERSGISIKQVLGYVNNLVEQDGAKVLLVANEEEIKSFKEITTKDKGGNDTTKMVYTEETEEYFKIKEKTVSDTILYLCDYEAAIESIFKMYSGSKIYSFFEQKSKNGKLAIFSEIHNVMADINDYNLRSFIFACQKAIDIFSNYDGDLDTEFLKHVFLGIVAFSLRLKNNDDIKWKENTSPNELGTNKYPLYKFCYEYIKYQNFDIAEIESSQEAFIERKNYENKQRETNTALGILYDFSTQKVNELNLAVETVRDELKTANTIPLVQYCRVANYLIAAKFLLEKPEIVDECKKIMLENIKNDVEKNHMKLDELELYISCDFWKEEQKEEYNEFVKKMYSFFKEINLPCMEDEDTLMYLEEISKFMCNRDRKTINGKKFLMNIDINKLVKGLEKATAKQVDNFRTGILSTYDMVGIGFSMPYDEDALTELKNGVQMLLESNMGSDKIVRLQYSWLLSNIDKVIGNY